MGATTECPEFTTITANTSFITTRNIAELVPNVFNRSVGTKVTLSCFETYRLVGNKYMECLSTGRWNTTMPTCLSSTTTFNRTISSDTGNSNSSEVGTSGSGSISSNVSSSSSILFGGDNQMTILIIIVIIVAIIALIILLILCCCLIWRNRWRHYKNRTKIDQYNIYGGKFGSPTHTTTSLHTDYPRTDPGHMAGNNVYYISEYISDQNNLRWSNRFAGSSRHSSEGLGEWMENRYPGDLIRYHGHTDENISAISRSSGHSYTHHDPYLWNDLQTYFKIPRPAYVN